MDIDREVLHCNVLNANLGQENSAIPNPTIINIT